MSSGHRLSACPGASANIRESRLQNHCVNQSNESRMNDCIGILYSDSEFVDLTPSLILAPPVYSTLCIDCRLYFSGTSAGTRRYVCPGTSAKEELFRNRRDRVLVDLVWRGTSTGSSGHQGVRYTSRSTALSTLTNTTIFQYSHSCVIHSID